MSGGEAVRSGGRAAFYEPLGGGRFASTPHTEGPWDPRHQHAGPPAALLGRAMERCEPRDGTLLARITYEILGPVPVAEVEVDARVARPGRTVELLEAELRAGGRTAMTARAWRLPETSAPPAGEVDAAPPARGRGPRRRRRGSPPPRPRRPRRMRPRRRTTSATATRSTCDSRAAAG